MRLLKISVHNLNSLYGEHVVDLENGLRNAPIFLVVGPTGAGKSTLMDAVCLALFGQTPRLSKERTDSDPDDDARNVMSRGTGFAAAQVEFSKSESGVEQRYQATWQCHRARKRPDGDYQLPRRILARWEDGQWQEVVASDKPKVYRAEFEAVLEGMNVEDFKRCVLLAQGEFAAFLDATDDERASILERLTDTAQYQQIGARAAQRRQEAKRAWQEGQARLQGVVLLSAEERDKLVEELRAIEPRAQALAKQAEAARAVRGWLSQRAVLEALRDEAVSRRDGVVAERGERAGELCLIEEHERCAPAWTALCGWRGMVLQVEESEAKVRGQQARQQAAAEEQVRLAVAEGAARAEHEAARKAREDKEPELRRARELRHQRSLEQAELARATSKATEMSRRKGELDRAQERLRVDETKAAVAFGIAEQAVASLASSRPLVEAVQAMRQRHDEIAAMRKELTKRRVESEDLQRRLEGHRAAVTSKTQEGGALEASSAEAESRAAEARASFALLLGEKTDARGRREELGEASTVALARRDGAQSGIRKLAEAMSSREKLAGIQEESSAVAKRLAEAASLEAEASRQLADLSGTLESRTRELEHLRWARDVAKERNRLRTGEACPLCGSLEHPLIAEGRHRERDAEIDATCGELERELARIGVALHEAGNAQTAAKTEQAALVAMLSSARQRQREVGQVLEEQARDLADILAALSMPPDANQRELEESLHASEAQSAAVAAQRKALDDAEQRVAAAETTARQLAERWKAVLRAMDDAVRDGAAVEEALGRLTADIQGVGERLAASGTLLRGELDAAGVVLRDDDGGFSAAIAEAERRVKALKRAEVALEQARARRDEARAAAERASSSCEAARVAESDALTEQQVRLASVEALEGQVVETLDGADPEQVQRTLDLRVEAVSARVEAVKAARSMNAAELAAVGATIALAVDAAGGQREERDRAREDVDGHLRTLEIADDEALQARMLDPGRCDELSALRSELVRRAQETATVLAERQSALEEHLGRRPGELGEPLPTVESVDATIGQLQADADGLHSRMGALGSQIAEDGRQRGRFEAIARECGRLQEEWQLWERLHALVGVGEGVVFQRFAQSLNLAELIGKANDHLARLAPRYALTQAIDAKGQPRIAFSVRDDWHAGEVRPLTTLSGGETFLVSLSLALSLAEYNTVKLPIETLLLDEGFGTLDQDTLNVVMRTLEALHSDGRQVGIITHVETLRERIEARVVVEKQGNGRSTVRVEVGDGLQA